MAVIQVQSKSGFTRDVLTKNNQANVKAVNEAWKEAGHEGSISVVLVKQIRSEMKLAGNIRPGRRAAVGDGAAQNPIEAPTVKTSAVVKRPVGRPKKSNGKHEPEATTPTARTSAVVKRPVGRPPGKANGKHEPAAIATGPKPKATPGDRSGSLTKLEGQIDDLIFAIKTAGGLPEFEEALRKARRILARSHEE